MKKQWDAFISHASEDKEEVARPLFELLSSYGAHVWYDEFALTIGDSLSRSIDKGLAGSKFGVVIFSPNFLAKDWPEYELKGLVAKELGRDKVILPIWHNVTREKLLEYSPTLADKFAIIFTQQSLEEISLKILAIIRPDLLTKIHRKQQYKEMIEKAEVEEIDPKIIKFGPIRHKELPPDLIGRIRLIRAVLWGADTHSMDFWLDGFKRDSHPSQEVAWWEHVAACYAEFTKTRELTVEQYKASYRTIFAICNNMAKTLKNEPAILGEENFKLLQKICKYRYPILDIEESFPEYAPKPPDDDIKSIACSDIEEFDVYPLPK
jgi:TIR domain